MSSALRAAADRGGVLEGEAAGLRAEIAAQRRRADELQLDVSKLKAEAAVWQQERAELLVTYIAEETALSSCQAGSLSAALAATLSEHTARLDAATR